MIKRKINLSILFIVFTISTFITNAQDLERKDVDLKYKWNLEDLYKTEKDWLADKEIISEGIKNVAELSRKTW